MPPQGPSTVEGVFTHDSSKSTRIGVSTARQHGVDPESHLRQRQPHRLDVDGGDLFGEVVGVTLLRILLEPCEPSSNVSVASRSLIASRRFGQPNPAVELTTVIDPWD